MFKEKKNFLIASKIVKKHLSYLKRKERVDIKQKDGKIKYKVKEKEKKNLKNIIKNASRLMDLLINLDADIK